MENKFCNYKNLELKKEEVKEVTEQELNDAINSLLARSNSFVEKDKVSSLGDVVNINFEGFVDGVAFEGGKGDNYDLELGSNTFIPGFEDQLVNHSKGDSVDVKVTFPENYQAENLKGKEAIFKCVVNAVKEKKVATLDDDFAKEHGCKDVEELRNAVKKEIEDRNNQIALNHFFEKICDHIIDNSEINSTQSELDVSLSNVMAYYEQMVAQYGMNLDQYLKMANKTMDDFKKIIEPDVIKGAKVNLILSHIAKEENITASDEEVNKELNNLKNYYHLTDAQLDEFKKSNLKEFVDEIIKRKVTEFLLLNNK